MWVLAGLLVALVIASDSALNAMSRARWERADAVCIGRGGRAFTASVKGRPDRVYCRLGARDGYAVTER